MDTTSRLVSILDDLDDLCDDMDELGEDYSGVVEAMKILAQVRPIMRTCYRYLD